MYSIKYRKLTLTQIRRSFISINCENKKWKKLKSDHALEWGQIKDTSQNWGFEIGDKNNPTEIELANNNNHPLKIWTTNNNERQYLKINQQYQLDQKDRDRRHERQAIWFYHFIEIAIMAMYSIENKTGYLNAEQTKFLNFLEECIDRFDEKNISIKHHQKVYLWMEKEIENMSNLSIDMEWFFTEKKSDSIIKKAFNKTNRYLILIKKGSYKNICGVVNESELMNINTSNNKLETFGNFEINDFNNDIEEIINRYISNFETETNFKPEFQQEDIVNTSSDVILENYDDKATRKIRKEQNKLRAKYINKNDQNIDCAMCGESIFKKFVWMSHLKPRNDCAPHEMGDPNVVIPMCKFGCDDLYEHGYIYIDNGVIKQNLSKPKNLYTKKMSDYILKLVGNKVKYWDGYRFGDFISNGFKRKLYCDYNYDKKN